MYNILLLDRDFKAIALIDDYQSLTWHRVYGNVGNYVLYVRPEVYLYTKDAYYLYLSDSKELALVECNELTNNQLIVRGNFYDTVYDREIVYPTKTFPNKYPEEIAYALINEYFPGIKTPAEIEGLGSKITTQFTGKSVLEVLQDICAAQALGFETTYSSTGNVLSFRLYQGLNRLSTQNENPFVDFSNNYDTLSEYEFTYDIRSEKNYALVAGEGEGDDRVTTTVDWSDGGDIKKLFVDARDLRQEKEMSDEEYAEILKERGREKLAERTAIENIEVTPIMTNYEYRVDYDLGDLCAADILHKDPRTDEVIFKAALDKRITELDEVYENNALTLKLTLGEQYATIGQAISSGGGVSGGGGGSISGAYHLQTYNSVKQLGLSAPTIIEAWEALPDGSILYEDAANFASGSYPENTSMIKMERQGYARGTIESIGKMITQKNYKMGLNVSGGATGTWQRQLDILNMVYPVGSIYLSVNNTNPGNIFGGTWVAWGSGRVPVGVNTGDGNFNTAEKTGGASTVTLNTNQIPSHGHRLRYSGQDNTGYLPNGAEAGTLINYSGSTPGQNGIFQDRPNTGYVGNFSALQNTGGGQAHNNLQPYITCYMWKRTA